jgi:hypothetical protein
MPPTVIAGQTIRATAGSVGWVPPPSLTTLELFGVPRRAVPGAVARMALDRGRLARTPGLRFWKLLGTGSGRTFTLRDADLRRWALLAVWDSPGDLVAFERGSPVAAAWGRLAEERWRVDLRPLRSKGTWSGRTPFATDPDVHGGPVAAITRARIRPGQWRAFWGAVPPVALDVNATPGLRFGLGIGEAPVGLQGTFTLWESAGALADFAYRGAPHRAVIAQTAARGWYAEELFARFAVLASAGTVAGRDPLMDARDAHA